MNEIQKIKWEKILYVHICKCQWSPCKIIDDIEDIGSKAQTKCSLANVKWYVKLSNHTAVGIYHRSKTSKKTKSSNYQLPNYWVLISIVVCYQKADKKD